jgi:hypothetical protein
MRACFPKREEFLEISVAADLLTRHRAVDGYVMSFDVLQDPVVGGRCPSDVVLGLKTIDRHHDLKAPQSDPLRWNRTDGAGDELRVDAAVGEHRQNLSKLAIPHERLTADNRHVERAMAVNERHEARHQLVAFVVRQAAQRDVAAKMIVTIRVAARTTKRTFSCDFDGNVRAVARKDAAPGLNDLARANVSRHVAAYYLLY